MKFVLFSLVTLNTHFLMFVQQPHLFSILPCFDYRIVDS